MNVFMGKDHFKIQPNKKKDMDLSTFWTKKDFYDTIMDMEYGYDMQEDILDVYFKERKIFKFNLLTFGYWKV
jgi:hypothetical protein